MADEPAAPDATENGIPSSTSHQRKPNHRRPRYPKKDKTDMKIENVDGEETPEVKKDPQISNKKCKYFKLSGKCKFGDKCRFRHPVKAVPEEDNQETPTEEKAIMLPEQIVHMPQNPSTRRVIPSKPVRIILKSDQIGSDEQKKAREMDILYFKRRFAGTIIKNSDNGITTVAFTYRVSNPEWVFDVNTVTFVLSLAPEHPIACVSTDIEQGMMPSPLQIYLIKKFNDMLKARHDSNVAADSFEPIGKWFIREVDKNILELFIVGLKRTKWLQDAHASGIKVTVFDAPQEPKRELTNLEMLQKAEEKETPNENEEPEIEKSEEDLADDAKLEKVEDGKVCIVSAPKAAQLKVAVNWVDSEQSVGTITFIALSGAARCLRCATQEFFDVSNGKEQSWKCKKCSTMQSIKFESVLGHQNSNIFGHVSPKGCRPVDCILLSSKLSIACMNCSKDFIVENLPYGTPALYWCRNSICNAKIRFAIDSIQFQGQFNAIPEGEKGVGGKVPKKKNLKDEIMLTIGQPLPKNGTCKHYGKSFRWFRFPCCGKLYPCDECHAAMEKDHEMKIANRMVCGLCSSEQPYSKESCKHCKGNVIKVTTAFWQGGTGCRNQIAMSKNDKKKYANSKKTIPTKRTGAEAKQEKEK